MRKLQELTMPELLELYNISNNSNLKIGQLEIKAEENCAALVVSINERNKTDALQLNISSKGCLYLFKIDNGQICPDVLPALSWLQAQQITPFYHQ